jgi:hypothetical protein
MGMGTTEGMRDEKIVEECVALVTTKKRRQGREA